MTVVATPNGSTVPVRYLDAVVVDRRRLTEQVSELQVSPVDGGPLPMAEAGTHLELRFGGTGAAFLRHYSVVGPIELDVSPEPFWRIAVQREDRARGSAYIHDHFRRGTRLQVSRPIGAFRLSRNLPHVLLVAGGIGITAILPMMRSLLIRRQPVDLVYIGAHRSTMAYVDQVEAMGGDRVRIYETSLGGRPDLDRLLADQPAGSVVYVCGPGLMIDALRDHAEQRGWAPNRIRFEVFNAAHKPEDVDFTVRLATGRTVQVGAGTTILDALEAEGVDTLSDCRRGECGLCLTDVLDPHEGIDHRSTCLTPEECAANTQMAICCSRPVGPVIDLDLS